MTFKYIKINNSPIATLEEFKDLFINLVLHLILCKKFGHHIRIRLRDEINIYFREDLIKDEKKEEKNKDIRAMQEDLEEAKKIFYRK